MQNPKKTFVVVRHMPTSPRKNERNESRLGKALFCNCARIGGKANELFEHKELANRRRQTPSKTEKDFEDDWEDDDEPEQSTEPDVEDAGGDNETWQHRF